MISSALSEEPPAQFHFGQQVYVVLLPAINLFVPLLPAVAANIGDRHAIDPMLFSASFTSSSLNGWMIASIFFICSPYQTG